MTELYKYLTLMVTVTIVSWNCTWRF